MDYSKLSDEELEKLANPGGKRDYASMSDEELERLANPPGELESALRGLAQGASLGFADEITGGAEALFTDKTYKQARDESRANYKLAKETNPNSYLAGEIGGGVATTLIPIGAAANTVRGTAALGGLIGAGAGLGGSEAEDAQGMAIDTLKGLGTGYVAGAAGKYGADKIMSNKDKAAAWLRGKAEERMFKALGPTKKATEEAMARGIHKNIGGDILDNANVGLLDSKKTILGKVSGLVDDSANELDNTLKSVSDLQGKVSPEKAIELEVSKFRPQELAERLKEQIRQEYSHLPQEVIEPRLKQVDLWLNKPGAMTATDAQAFKTQMQKFIKDGSYLKDNPGASQETLLGIRKGIKEGIENNANEASRILGQEGDQIKNINKTFGGRLEAEDILEDRVARDATNRTFSLTDYLAMIPAAAGDPVSALTAMKAAAVGGANKLVREKGSQVAAIGTNKLSKFLAKSPRFAKLAESNPKAFNALAADLSRRFEAKGIMKSAGFNPQGPVDEEQAKQSFLEGN